MATPTKMFQRSSDTFRNRSAYSYCILTQKLGALRLSFCALSLNESTCQTKNIFLYFHLKSSGENFKFHDVIKRLSIKEKIHFTE